MVPCSFSATYRRNKLRADIRASSSYSLPTLFHDAPSILRSCVVDGPIGVRTCTVGCLCGFWRTCRVLKNRNFSAGGESLYPTLYAFLMSLHCIPVSIRVKYLNAAVGSPLDPLPYQPQEKSHSPQPYMKSYRQLVASGRRESVFSREEPFTGYTIPSDQS